MSGLQFDIVGADGARTFFSKLNRTSVGHAYLFSGPPGVGKKTFARRLAQSLLCEGNGGAAVGYDGTCPSCRLFSASDASRHPDFLEHIGTLKIGDADGAAGFYEADGLSSRDIVRLLSLESYSGGMRVLLLGDIEFATHHAANALLKFLEEPPGGIVLILTTPAPGRLISTIRSRLVDVRFPALTAAQVCEVLERLQYSPADARRAAALAQGSITRAVAALDGDEESLRGAVATWFFATVRGETPEGTWASRETLDDGLETVKALARDWVAIGATEGAASLVATDYGEQLRALKPLERRDAIAVLAKIDDAQRLARTNVSPAMVADLVRMMLSSLSRS
jgi:DNA polymerase-3 subunit delta'